MALEKVLQKIRAEMNEMKPSLEIFLDDTIQPSVDDCLQLQHLLVQLQENLAVYKYDKNDKELSPSFHLHARISEVQVPETSETKVPEPKTEVSAQSHLMPERSEESAPAPEVKKDGSISRRLPSLAVGLNDKFRFINELFAQNASEYHIALEQLNNLHNWSDTEIYLNSLRSLYEWNEQSEVVKHFYSLVKKRYD